MTEINVPAKRIGILIPLEMSLSRPREDYIAMRTSLILKVAKSGEDALRQLTELNREIRKKDRAEAFEKIVESLLRKIRIGS